MGEGGLKNMNSGVTAFFSSVIFTGLYVTLFFCCREKEAPVPATVTVKNKPTLKKSFSTSSIPKEIINFSSVGVEDIDRDDKGDPFLLPEYINDIYAYLRDLEVRLGFNRELCL